MPGAVAPFESRYAPILLRQRLAGAVGAPTPGWEDLSGAVLFADVHGFTALAEALQRHTNAGTERLTRILNGYFGELVAIIERWGGDVVKFAGDSLLALWPGDPAASGRLAAACALDVQRKLRDYDAGDGVRLQLRVAVATGALRAAFLGGVDGRFELLLVGPPITSVGTAIASIAPGEVGVAPEAFDGLGATGTRKDRAWVLRGLPDAPSPTALRAPELTEAGAAALRGFIPAPVLAAQAAGQEDWLPELRRVTVLFVNLPDLDHDTSFDRGQELMAALQSTVHRFEGTVNKLSVDDKGVSLVAAFGLPPLSHEDDAVRGVRAALRMREEIEALGLRCAVGVATGRVYCGSVGGDHRREYTVIGDVVNLAARLMQAARDDAGRVLVDAATRHAASSRCEFVDLPAIAVKGRAGKVEIFRPESVETGTGGGAVLDPIVGRHAERALLVRRLEMLGSGTGGVMLLSGEAGIGKSRLVLDVLEQAGRLGVRALVGAGDAVEKSTPYFAWRAVVAQLFGIEGRRDLDGMRADVEAALAVHPELPPLLPLLSAVLPLDLPDTERTARMDGHVRADNLHRVLADLICARAESGPLLVVLEDVHWMDSASWDLVRIVARDVPKALLLLASRPLEAPYPPVFQWLFRPTHTTSKLEQGPDAVEIRLEPMGEAEVVALVSQRLGVASLPEPVARLLRSKAEGHPFFAEELALALRDAGYIAIRDGCCQITGSGGDLLDLSFGSLEGVITSRIDRLPAAEQLTLKAASVVGRVFGERILRDVHPVPTAAGELEAQLDDLVARELTVVEAPEPDRAWLFKHVITQQVAYNLMLFSQRQQLHRAVAEWYERAHAADLAPYHPLLAYHWGRAGEGSRAVDHLEKAGEIAVRGNANRDAIAFLREALSLAERHPVDDARRARWEHLLCEAEFALGNLDASREHAESSLALYGWPRPTSTAGRIGAIVWELAVQAWRRWVGGGGRHASGPERALWLTYARVHERLTEVDYLAGLTVPSFLAMMRSINAAEAVGPTPELVRGYSSMALGLSVTGNPGLAEAYVRLTRATDQVVDEPTSRAWMQLTTCTHAMGLGRFEEAISGYDAAAAFHAEQGDWSRWANVRLPSGWAMMWGGRVEEGRARFTEVVQAWRRHSNPIYHAIGLAGEAAADLRLGREVGPIRAALEQGLEAMAERPDRAPELVLHGPMAIASLRAGDPERARQAVDAALDIMAGTDPLAHYLSEGYAGVAEAAILLLAASPSDAGARARVNGAMKGLAACAKVFPISRPRHHGCKAALAKLDGKASAAKREWDRSAREAEASTMPLDRAAAAEGRMLLGGGIP